MGLPLIWDYSQERLMGYIFGVSAQTRQKKTFSLAHKAFPKAARSVA
jgi:hypothetical protein